MNLIIGVGEQKQPQASNAAENLTAIWQLLTLIQADTSLVSELSQSFAQSQFQLGDRLLNYTVPSALDATIDSAQSDRHLYLVSQGRVRLLGFDIAQQRDVSSLVLEVGDTFGLDELFDPHAQAYRAIAASDGEIAQIPISQLSHWLKQLPELEEHLRSTVAHRQRQIFFKTCTDGRQLTSHQLKQLQPYLVERQITSGQSLAAVTPSSAGRFWLRRGEIYQPQNAVSITSPGVSWGYPETTPPDWMAQTDLWVYQLSRENWSAAAAIAPAYFSSDRAGSQNGHKVIADSRKGVEKRKISPSPSSQKSRSPSIVFPKPATRRLLDFFARYPFIAQQSATDCGATCLAMIGQYWGKRFSLNLLRNLTGVGRTGASLKGLAKAAESLGFQARPVRASLSRLVEQENPWIAHWEGDHYVVVYQCRGDWAKPSAKGDRILISDPAMGKRSLSRSEFLASWTGYALLLEPTQQLQAAQTPKISLGQFLDALWPYRHLIGQIIFASLLIQLFGIVSPLFTQIILDQVVVNKSLTALNVFALGLLLFGVWGIAASSIRQYLLYYFSNRFDLTLIGGFISHTLRLPLKFFESRRVGDIITRVQENQKIQQFLVRHVVITWLDLLMGAAYLGLMLYYNWQLTLLVLGLIPPIAILTLVATPFLRRISREIFKETAEQNSLLVEMLTGIATVKAAAAEQEVRWRWEDHFTSSLNAGFRGQKLGIILQSISGLINTVGSTALLWYGATLVIQDQLTIGQFVAFNMMIGKVIAPFLSLVDLWDELQEVVISVERLNDVFEAKPEESPGNPMLVLPTLQGVVRVENVTFRYNLEEERNTLQNITFEAQVGQTIAIVGRSGSGKSTLVRLLQSLYHPDSGRILMDGHDIRHISPQSLRSQMGVVPQECFLFSGTILENITLYRSEFTLEQVIEVAKLAEAHGFIQDLPLGYNTKVGERGSSLSGGQRQRIAIARALLGNPRILVLDEATSSLDTESERRFQQNLERLVRDRTTFIIAHRLSTVRNADSILVLDRGILLECGTHTELMATGGLYYHLAQQQLDL